MKTVLILIAAFCFIMAGLSLFLVIALWSEMSFHSIVYVIISLIYIYFAKEILKKIKGFND